MKAKDLSGDVEDALATPADRRTEAQSESLLHYWMETSPEFHAENAEIEGLRKQFPASPTSLVMQERPADHPRPTYRHHRGEYLQPREKVEPGLPAILPPLPANVVANRLSFARYLVSPDNPLTARVTVNRQWQAFFGRGLVRTLDDFGYQGRR